MVQERLKEFNKKWGKKPQPRETTVLTREQALADYGYDSPMGEDYFVKFTPAEQGLDISFISPDKWELKPDRVISPEGKEFTYADIEKQQADYARIDRLKSSEWYNPETNEVNVEGAIKGGFITSEDAALMFPQLPPEAGIAQRQAEIQAEFQLPPEAGIAERQHRIYESLKDAFATLWTPDEVNKEIQLLQNDPNAWLGTLREKGWNHETEALLKTLMPGITDDQVYGWLDPEGFVAMLQQAGRTEQGIARLKAVFPSITDAELDDYLPSQPARELPKQPPAYQTATPADIAGMSVGLQQIQKTEGKSPLELATGFIETATAPFNLIGKVGAAALTAPARDAQFTATSEPMQFLNQLLTGYGEWQEPVWFKVKGYEVRPTKGLLEIAVDPTNWIIGGGSAKAIASFWKSAVAAEAKQAAGKVLSKAEQSLLQKAQKIEAEISKSIKPMLAGERGSFQFPEEAMKRPPRPGAKKTEGVPEPLPEKPVSPTVETTPKGEIPANVPEELVKDVNQKADEVVKTIDTKDFTPEEIKTAENIIKREAYEAGGIKPPPDLPPKTDFGTPEPNEDAVNKLTRLIRAAKRLAPSERAEAELLRHEDKSKRVAQAVQRLKGGEGQEAFYKARGALYGKYAIPVFKPPKNDLAPKEITKLFDQIKDAVLTGKTRYFEGDATQDALMKLLNGEMPTARELKLLENMFGSDLVKAVLDKRNLGQKAWSEFISVLNLPRALKASIDLSAPFRQGISLSMGQPKEFWSSFGRMFKTIFSEASAEQLDNVIRSNRFYELADDSGLYIAPLRRAAADITEHEEAFMSRFAEYIPGIRQSERAYVSFLNKLRADTFYSYAKKWEYSGRNPKDYKDLAQFINWATGRGDLPRSLTGAGSVLNAAFFSPRFAASRLEMMSLPFTMWTKTPAVRKVILRNVVSFVGTGLSALALIKMTGAGDVELDPRSSDFGKIRIGNLRYDFWGGFQQWARFIAQIVTAKRKATSTGLTYDINRLDTALDLVRSKESPIFGLGWDLFKGESFTGEPVGADLGQTAKDLLLPMVIQDIWEGITEDGIMGGVMATPSFLGFGVQTFDGSNWNDNFMRLGTPLSDDTLPFTTENKIYDTKQFYSDTLKQVKDLPINQMADKYGFTEQVKAIAEARDIKDSLEFTPRQALKSINADTTKGDTYEQYYRQWQERAKITDKDKLADFDKQYPQAKQGNMTFRQYDLLRQYNSLPTDKDKSLFLKDNPELNTNQYEDYLREHPEENAKLALWGQAKLLTLEAWQQYQTLKVDMDIPDSALTDNGLPDTEDEVKNFFKYQETITKYGYDSPEAELMIFNDSKLREFTKREIPKSPLPVLEIKIKNRKLDDELETLETKGEIERWKASHKDWQDDQYRIEAYRLNQGFYGKEATKDIIKDHVEYKNKQTDLERDLYRLDNPDYDQWGQDVNGWKPLEIKSEDALKLKVKNQALSTERSKLITEAEQADWDRAHPEYLKDQSLIEAYNKGATKSEAEQFADYELKSTLEKKLQMVTDEGFADFIVSKMGRTVPEVKSVEALKLEIKNKPLEDEYDKILEPAKKAQWNAAHPEVVKDRLKIAAYNKGVPDNYIENYVDFNSIKEPENFRLEVGKDKEGKPVYTDLPWYVDDWYLMDNPDFYNNVYVGILGKEKDFTKVPSRIVFAKYLVYLRTPEGINRTLYRMRNKDLDDWLVASGKASRSAGNGNGTLQERLAALKG